MKCVSMPRHFKPSFFKFKNTSFFTGKETEELIKFQMALFSSGCFLIRRRSGKYEREWRTPTSVRELL